MKTERELIKTPKAFIFPGTREELRKLDDAIWKNEIFRYLLLFYKNFNINDIKKIIEEESKKQYPKIENKISKFIRLYLKNEKSFHLQFDVTGESTNDEEITGYYDIVIGNTYWKSKKFYFECKNLNEKQDLINKYVYYNKSKSEFDGGVYRFFNGKYAQEVDFGGMIGYVLEGNVLDIKLKIKEKLEIKFDITPEGDLLEFKNNAIEKNDFTFESLHNRQDNNFLLHHLIFDFT